MKNLSLIPFVFLLFSIPVYGQAFSDVSTSHPYYTALSYLKINGVINGYPDSSFQPYKEINRAELLKILMESSEVELSEPSEKCFTDVPTDQWYSNYVCSAKEIGLIEGYSDGSFRPASSTNKVEALSMLSEIFSWPLSDPTPTSNQLFFDTPDDQWYAKDIAYAKSKNLLEESGTIFSPAEYITRANISGILYKQLATTELKHTNFTSETELTIQEKYNIETTEELLQIAPNNIRIELSWQNSDVDLDLHLIKPIIIIEDGKEVPSNEEVYFFNKYGQDYESYLIQTDNNETINIDQLQEGKYTIFANLYEGDISFSYAAAQVKLYQNNQLIKTFSPLADPDSDKNIWKILEISKLGDLTIFDQIGGCDLLTISTVACN